MVLPPDFSQLNQIEQQRLAKATNFKQMQNVIATLEQSIQECFEVCVVDLTLPDIQKEERNCLKKCHQKFFNAMDRSSFRFVYLSLKQPVSQLTILRGHAL